MWDAGSWTDPCHRRRRHCVVVEDRIVAPVWPRRMAARHRSAGGRWWFWRSWSIQWLRGRPELRTQSRWGRLPSDASTCSLSAWWAGMLGNILATCPKMASRRLLMLSITGRRPDPRPCAKFHPNPFCSFGGDACRTDRQTDIQTNKQTDRQTSKVNIPKYTMRETIKSYLQTVLQPDLKLFKWTLQLRLQQLPQHFQWFCYIHHNSNDIRWFAVTFHLAATTAVIYYHTLLLSYAGAATCQHWSTSYCVHCTLSPWTRRSCILIRCSVTVYGYKFIITLCVCTLQR